MSPVLSYFATRCVTLWLVLVSCLKILGRWLNPMNAFCCSMNVDGVVFLFGGGGDTSKLHAVIELVKTFFTFRNQKS